MIFASDPAIGKLWNIRHKKGIQNYHKNYMVLGIDIFFDGSGITDKTM